jgi:predicted Rossmann-fold nucleotide-binding protein
MLREGMIDEADLNLIILTDDLSFVAKEIEKSLIAQMETLEKEGLDDTKYYQVLSSYMSDRDKREGSTVE